MVGAVAVKVMVGAVAAKVIAGAVAAKCAHMNSTTAAEG